MPRASKFVLITAAALSTSFFIANIASSAASLVLEAEPIADQSVPKEAQGKPLPKMENQSCWHPGLSRNIGIAEQSCDVFTLEPRTPPQSERPCSRNRHQRAPC
jgi:hypothetical protein